MVSVSPERSPRGAPSPKATPPTDRPLTVTMYDPKSPDAQARVATTYDGKQFKTRKRKTMSKEMREKVALVRRLGACDVCKARRVACSPDHHRDPSRFSQNKGSSSSGLSSGPQAHRPLQILPALEPASHMPRHIYEQSVLANVGARFQDVEYIEPEVFNRDPALQNSSQPPAKRPASNCALSIQAMTGVEPSAPGPYLTSDQLFPQSPVSHEVTRTSQYMEFQRFSESLEEAIKEGSLPGQGDRYSSVHVLILQWELDPQSPRTNPLTPEVDELAGVFRELYKFDVEIGLIPREQPSKWISRKMINFVEKADDSRDALKILYYGGHSFISESREDIWSSHPRDHPRNCVLNMKTVQDMLVEANSDALLILDACASGSSMTSSPGRGVVELIAARSWDRQTSISYTFTRALVTELQLANKLPFSIAHLHNNLFRRIQNQMEIKALKELNISAPVHLVLSSSTFARLIRLAPLEARRHVDGVSEARQETSMVAGTGIRGAPCIQFSIRLLENADSLSVDLFREWLRTIPGTVTDIKVAATFEWFQRP